MCRTHGPGGTFAGRAWTSSHRTPPLYPDAVTLRPEAGLADVLTGVDTTRGCSVKDSFARLDLSGAGFAPLVEAEWIDRPADGPTPPPSTPWVAITTAPELAEWATAWDGGITGLFRPRLLAHPAVRVLAARRGGEIVAGAVVNRSGSVTGVSNLFAVDGHLDEAWAGLLSALPRQHVVGYETGPALAAAHRLGFTSTGRLRVWVRTSG
ncbi:hypothetical protein CFP66_04800 [Pseudonocardia sp. MH-G8]|nr:hypothetical protein CFP66_04800 [Pseudonocardia sp. MH-G8]